MTAMAAVTTELAEVVADELELASVAVRSINIHRVAAGTVGLLVGVGIGAYVGYRYAKKKATEDAFARAEEVIDEMREHYAQKVIALDTREKPDPEQIALERGYISSEPGAETTTTGTNPSEATVTMTETLVDKVGSGHVDYGAQHRDAIPTPIVIDPSVERVFRTAAAAKDKDEDWDEIEEHANRNEEDPYIIHQDEFTRNESGYEQLTYIYYAGDDVLVDASEPDVVINHRDTIFGDLPFVKKFGHGSDDYNVLHIRNPFIEVEFLINRVPGSWEAEVIGPEPDDD